MRNYIFILYQTSFQMSTMSVIFIMLMCMNVK